VLWVQNGPRDAPDDVLPPKAKAPPPPAVPPRGAGTPDLAVASPSGLEAVFGVVVTPIVALTVTRDGHGSQEASDAQRQLWQMNQDVEPADPNEIGSSYFQFGMFENPNFAADPNLPPLSDACAAIGRAWAATPGQMSEVSMSWWLSQSVQAELDAQVCDKRNRQTFADLAKRLSQRCPQKSRDPSSGKIEPAAAGAPDRCQ
jgi:hypothetical protein